MKRPIFTDDRDNGNRCCWCHPHAAVAQQAAVTQWHANAQALVTGFTGRGNAAQAYTLALIQVAVYDAVCRGSRSRSEEPAALRAVHRRCGVRQPARASSAAVATAAFRVGYERVNSNEKARTTYKAAYETHIAAIPDGRAKIDGIATGEATARAVLAARSTDNFYNSDSVRQPVSGPGRLAVGHDGPAARHRRRQRLRHGIHDPFDRVVARRTAHQACAQSYRRQVQA